MLIITMKGIGLPRCLVILLISLANVNARPWFETMLNNKEETYSANPNIFEEIQMLSWEACNILPSEFKDKCLETSKSYVQRTKLVLLGILDEEILCNRSGLCLLKTVSNLPIQVTDEGACVACRRAVKDLFYQLKQSKIRMKVMDALLEYCEEMEDHEEHCKETVYRYAPSVLDKLEKLKSNDVCRVIGFCDDGLSV